MERTSFLSFWAIHVFLGGTINIILDMSDRQQIDGLLARVAGDVEAVREYCGRNGGQNGGMSTKSHTALASVIT